MQDVLVKLLSGAQFSVQCCPDDTLAQLRRRLEEQREGLRRCKLNLRGAFLDDTVTVAELVLQPGDFLVAFETRKKSRQAAPAAPHVPPPPVQLTPAAARLQCQASGSGGQQQRSTTITPPSSPCQQWAAHGGGPGRHVPPLGSPGMPDSLLPGYLSRPNPSPVKARLHLAPPAAAASHKLPPDEAEAAVPGGHSAAQQPSARPARARQSLSLLDLAEQRFGGSAGSGEVAQTASPQHEPRIQQAKAPLALASQASEASGSVLSFSRAEGAESSMLLPQGVDAAFMEPQEPQPRRRAPMRGAGSKRKQPSNSVPAGTAAHQQQQQQQHAASGPSPILPSAAAAAAGECQSRLLLSEAELDVAAAALPLPPVAQRLEAAFAVLAQVHAFLTGQHIQATWAHIRQSAAGLHLQQPLTLPDVRLAAAVCPELVSLQQHHRLDPRSRGDSWRLAVSSPHKARAVLAAAAAAEAAAGQQGQPLPNPMHLLTDGAGTVLGGGAAAGGPAVDLATGLAASTAAGGGGSAAGVNSAQLAADDTLVVEVADPGKGFLARPIPTAFLQYLRHQSQAQPAGSSLGGSTTQEQDLCMAEGEIEVELPGSGDEGGEEAGLNSNGSTQPKPTTAAAAAAAAAGSAAGPQPAPAKRRQFRVNKAVRQRWCFRRALVRALLLLQQQHMDSSASAGSAEQQQEGQQQQEQQRRRPRRGKGSAAAPSSLGGVVAPWQQGRWHPSFDTEAVTSDQLAAAGNLLAAPLRAAAAAAEQEASAADALQAARRSRRRDAAAPAAPAAAAAGGVAAGLLLAGAKPPQLLKQHAPCTDTTEMDTTQFLSHLKQLPWYQGQVQHTEQMPARRARHATPLTPLAPAVAAALQLRGVRQLFLHQAAAVDHLLQGRHTVVATSTASGKSLCYIIPILQALAQDRSSCALLMFPTKALAQDQLRALRELLSAAFGSGGERGVPAVEVYDGDTPVAERGGVRDRAQLLITNPDMLHMSVLPVHPQFGRLLANLQYVVVDEGHAYKGVFGCHAALVLRRLRRLCDRVYHSQPTFAVTTATLANPREHALELLGVSEVEVVGEDGSPHGPRTFVMWNPPVLQPWGQGAQSRTESRAGGRRRAQQAQRLRQRQEANQERGAGVLDERPRVSQAQRLSDAKLNLRRQQLEAAVTGQQPELLVQQPEPPPPQQQHNNLQLAAHSPQHPEDDARASRVPHVQHPPLHAPQQQPQRRQQPTAALRREIAEAKVALAAVGGSQVRAAARAATRPLIRRQPVGARAALELLAVSSAAGGSRSGPSPPGQAASSSAATGEADDYRSRLPDNKDWKAAAQAAAGGKGLSGRDGNGRGSGRGRGSGTGGSRYKARQERDSNIGDKDGEGGGEGDDDEDEAGDERRSSPIVELSLLLAECVQHGLRTIAFCKSRKLCELVTAYVREVLKCTAPHLTGSIAVYRAGYSPAERREIEGALFRGSLRAVAATNALELGVDVGSLDCTLHLGFPGSVASLWQQAGRAGRREQACLGIYLGWDGPLDQYFMRHPSQLFGRPIERAMVDARNPSVLEAHLTCAAAEAPLLLDMDQHFFGPDLPALAAALQRAALLGRHPMAPSPRVMHYVGAVTSPASKISLRAIDPERYAIVDESQDGQLLEEIEESKAFFQVYDGAVYMYQGRTYLCKKLDLDAKVAVVRPAEVKYYTKCIDFTDVHVRGGRPAFAPPAQPQAQPQAAAAAAAVRSSSSAGNIGGGAGSSADQQPSVCPVAVCSPAVVTVRWLGFRRVWRGSGEVFDSVDLFLPDVQFDTEAAYCRLPHATRQHLKEAGLPFREGVHAACHALLNVLPLYLMCNPSDVATECDNPFDTRFKPERILIFDKHPGGIGLSAAAAPLFPELLRRALELVRECACSGRSGCPACVQHTECNEYNAVLNKRAACVVLESLLRGEDGAG